MEKVEVSPEHQKALETLEALKVVVTGEHSDRQIFFTQVKDVCEQKGMSLHEPRNITRLFLVASVESTLRMGKYETAQEFKLSPVTRLYELADDMIRSVSTSLYLRQRIGTILTSEIENQIQQVPVDEQTYERIGEVLFAKRGEIVTNALRRVDEIKGLDQLLVSNFGLVEHYFVGS